MYNQKKCVALLSSMCGRHLGFSPYGQPSGSSSTKYFSMLAAAAAVGAGYALFLLPLTLASADFVYFSFYVCSRQQQQQQQKAYNFLSALFTHRKRERRRALIDFGALFVVCARRSLCSFSSARHIFLFPLCATLLPLRCLPACCVCLCVSGSAYVCTCSTDTFTFSFFIFSACFCLAHTQTETDTRTPTLLCRFYNLSLLCVCVCVCECARTPCLICSLRCCQISHTPTQALSNTRNAYTASNWTFCHAAWKFHLFTFYAHVQNNKSTIITSTQ